MHKNLFNGYDSLFAKRLMELLEENKVTQSVVAMKIGVSRQAISQYCNGQTIPTADKLRQLAEYFHVSADYLLGLSGAKTNDPDAAFIADYTGLSAEAIEELHTCLEEKKRFDSMTSEERTIELNRPKTINEELRFWAEKRIGADPFPFLNYFITNGIVPLSHASFLADDTSESDVFKIHAKMLNIAIKTPSVLKGEPGFYDTYSRARRDVIDSLKKSKNEDISILEITEEFKTILKRYTQRHYKKLINARSDCFDACIAFEKLLEEGEIDGNDTGT